MKKVLLVLAAVVVLASCEKKQDPFEWNKTRVGHVTDSTMVYQLDALYANDSLVKSVKGDAFSNGPSDIEVYEKGGKHLLTLSPVEDDSTSTIEYIKIHDARYKTAKGITIASNFKQISDAYKVSGIENMIMDAVVRVNDENFYFTVEKSQLPTDLQFDMNATIEKSMIPDDATVHKMIISW